jgi:NAD(P)-dependent dehydrogenase (short-subunit alcohol dehydrogenase family)
MSGRVVVITGGAGLLGRRHADAVAELGARPVLLDLDADAAAGAAREICAAHGVDALGLPADITSADAVAGVCDQVLQLFGRVDGLINNAANNPKVEGGVGGAHWSWLEEFPVEVWDADLAVGLKGAFLCSRVFGAVMAERGAGAIVNIASDLALIAPDQRIYREPGVADEEQFVKPVTYSVVKAGLVGMTRYLATYWADRGVRVNAISPGGVEAGQDEAFVARLTNLIPLGRMARADEYKAAIAFLVSDASSYMTGANLVIDGGRTAW